MIKRLPVVLGLAMLTFAPAAGQEMYLSISGKSVSVQSGDTRHTYDIWIKPEGDVDGTLQVYDAGLGGAVDLIVENDNNTSTSFRVYPFNQLYSEQNGSVAARANGQDPIVELIAASEERYRNRWVPLTDVSVSNNSGYLVRVSADNGDDVNSFNFRVVDANGRVLTGTSWKIIAIDLSIGIFQSDNNKYFQLKPYSGSAANAPDLIVSGEEDSQVKKLDSFGGTYALTGERMPANRFGLENNWGIEISGSDNWLNNLTITGRASPVLWVFEPLVTDAVRKPQLLINEKVTPNCTEKAFEIQTNAFSRQVLSNAQWVFQNNTIASGPNPAITFQTRGNTEVDVLLANRSAYLPEYWVYNKPVFLNTPPIARLQAPKEVISPSERITLSAENSYDLEGRELEYTWIVNGAVRGTEPTFTFSNTISGLYTISLRVSDGGSSPVCSSDEQEIQLRVNTQPYAEILIPEVFGTSERVLANVANASDADNDQLTYSWSGIGIVETSVGDQVGVLHQAPGNYSVSLSINDNSGADNAAYRISKTYEVNASPVAQFLVPDRVAPGEVFQLDGNASSDANGNPLSFRWFVNTNEVARSETAPISFTDPGMYEITLEVDDGRGVSNSKQRVTRTVSVNASPTPVITATNQTSFANVEFSGLNSTDSESQIVSYAWDFGDGQSATGPNVTHIYQQPGEYTVQLTVDDGSGLANSSQTTEHKLVINRFPVADFTAPVMIAPGQEFSVDGTVSSDADGGINTYEWFADGEPAGSGPRLSLSFTEPGPHSVTLRVTDNSGYELAQGLITKQVTVNRPPVVLWETIPDALTPNTEIIFTAADSYDPDGNIDRYIWQFEDGTEIRGKQIQRFFTEPGPKRFTLTVIDDAGLSNSRTVVQGIANINHQPYIVSEKTIRSNSMSVKLDASGSYDLDNDPIDFEWTLPDGSKRKEASFTWQAPVPGVHIIGLTLDDKKGLDNSVNTESIQVLVNRPVKAVVESQISSCTGQTVLFNSSQSFDPDGDPFKVQWDFGNGVTSEEANPSFVYETPGIYEATLTLNDGISELPTITKIPVIIEGSPVAKVDIADTTICVNTALDLDGSASTDPSGGSPALTWDMGDGTTLTGPKIRHIFTQPGDYTVSLLAEGSGSGQCGNISQTTTRVKVIEGPIAEFNLPEWISPGELIALDGSGSYADGGFRSATWSIDSENLADKLEGLQNSYTFNVPGEYFVTLTLVTNTETACNTISLTKSLNVNAAPEVIWSIPETIAEGSDLKLDALQTKDPDGYIKEYKWFIDDGFVSRNASEIIKYIAPGEHKVTLEVLDNSTAANNRVVLEKTFFANSAPKPQIIGPDNLYLNEEVRFSSGLAQDADRDPLTSTWFLDGQPIPAPSFTPTESRMYQLKLVQDDGRGLPNSVDSAIVEITPDPIPAIVSPNLPERIALGGSLNASNLGLPAGWNFQGTNGAWIANSVGTTPIIMVYAPQGKTLATDTTQIEVVDRLRFESTPAPVRVAWNPVNPTTIVSAPGVNRAGNEVQYTWKQDGRVLGLGTQLQVELIRGPNRFVVEVIDLNVDQSVPASVEIVVTAQ
ncbi:MAG: PKD domain-containing protein [Bacteroidota bacterium]